MDKSYVAITYKTADGEQICVEVSTEVKELLEQSDRQIRTQWRQDRRHLDHAGYVDGLSDAAIMHPQENVTDLLMKKERYEQLRAALNTLSEVQRRRLLLHYVAHKTYRQIAKLEGIHQATVGRSIQRALRKLQQHFDD